MDTPRALELLRSLADGRDPFTGRPFPPDSPYQQADIVRALYCAIEALQVPEAKPKAAPEPSRPAAGKPWTPEEEQRLREAFASNPSIAEIAAAHGRTRGAISSRLIKLGLIEPPAHSQFPPKPGPAKPASLPQSAPSRPSNETIIPTQTSDPAPEDLKDLPF
jgi:hypothetical protein